MLKYKGKLSAWSELITFKVVTADDNRIEYQVGMLLRK